MTENSRIKIIKIINISTLTHGKEEKQTER
jgi:hypothetical protein